jgi:hypothetical protein
MIRREANIESTYVISSKLRNLALKYKDKVGTDEDDIRMEAELLVEIKSALENISPPNLKIYELIPVQNVKVRYANNEPL